ncbi:hypothetical protein [Armatimonas sp.]|uniref:hypothetical protein n=1 Tax=Armatimonas sp. TaxID=1872638 RepID=UPI00286A17AD|nr:hypothetical protein [Armatimonas sp.]
MRLTRRQHIAKSLGVLQILGLAGFVGYSCRPSQKPLAPSPLVQRIPELDNQVASERGVWLGNDKVLTGPWDDDPLIGHGTFNCTATDIFDLRTHTHQPLPHLPPLKGKQDSYHSNPVPSPDGKWLLYEEPRRWWLVRPDGSGARWIPFPTDVDYFASYSWLADSSGWVGMGSTQDEKRVTYRFWLDSASHSPIRLNLPEYGHLEAITNQDELIFSKDRSFRLLAIPLNAGAAKARELDVHQGTLNALWPGKHGGTWPLAFSRDGRFLIVRGYPRATENHIADWFPSFLKSTHLGLWRVSLDGGVPEQLVPDDEIADFSLSPDGTKILYWSSGYHNATAYLLTLNEKV